MAMLVAATGLPAISFGQFPAAAHYALRDGDHRLHLNPKKPAGEHSGVCMTDTGGHSRFSLINHFIRSCGS